MTLTPEEAKRIAEEVNKQKREWEDILFSIRDITNEAISLRKELEAGDVNVNELISGFRDLGKFVSKTANSYGEVLDLSKSTRDLEKEAIGFSKKRELLSTNQASIGNRILSLEKEAEFLRSQGLKTSANAVSEDAERLKILHQQAKAQIENADAAKDQLDYAIEISKAADKATKSFTTMHDFIKSIPGLKAFAGPFKEAEEEARKVFLTSKNKQQALSAGFKQLGASLKKMFGPAFLLTELFSAIGKVDKEITNMAQGMAMTKNEAAGYRAELAEASKLQLNNYANATRLVEALNTLQKQTGIAAQFSTDTLITFNKLTKVVGLSAEGAGGLAQASIATGTSMEENYKNVLGTTRSLQEQTGIQFDNRQILEAVGRVSGRLRANLEANPSAIAEAVTHAKLLGLELEGLESITQALLNFESNIGDELTAELLTGKQLNLEKARLAALTGDQAALAKEIKDQAGDFTEFTQLNVLQQQELAKAFGLSADQMSDMLFKQEIQNKTAKELRAMGKEEAAEKLEQQTAQQKFNDTVMQLKEIFADVATALMPIVEAIGSVVSLVGFLLKPLGALINWAQSFHSIMGVIVGLMVAAAAAAVIFNSAATFGIGAAALIAGSAIGLGLLYSETKPKPVNDLYVDPQGNAYEPAGDDHKIFTKDPSSIGGGGEIDYDKMASALGGVINDKQVILNTGTNAGPNSIWQVSTTPNSQFGTSFA